MNIYDVAIIGGGASGLMCSIEAGKRGRSVIVLERSEKPGRKILISGGGRCNFTNLNNSSDNYISSNPHFCKSALSRYTHHDFIDLVKRYNVGYYEKTAGQLFCINSSSDILNILISECKANNVEIKVNTEIKEIIKSDYFNIDCGTEVIQCSSLVVAAGGLSIPKMGATGFGIDIAKQFGINIIEPLPALTGMMIDRELALKIGSLSGVSFEGKVVCRNKSFTDKILFTHKGLSGPAILQISNYWNNGEIISIDILPGIDILEKFLQWQKEFPKAELKNLLSYLLPKRFAHLLAEEYLNNKPVIQYSEKEIKSIEFFLHNWSFVPSGLEGFEKAEVTRGGIDTNELSSKTFESKKVKGLYFIGEIIDVTGWLGGYNFQWAWSSGFCAGQYV